jgi:hypothetical protein
VLVEMTFRAEIDSFFITLITITLLIISSIFIFPFIFDYEDITTTDIVVVLSIFILSAAVIIWTAFFIHYKFYDDYLYIKGGPFRSRILYDEITKVSPTEDIYTGYRVLSSRNSIEISYKSGFLGSVKISPKEQKYFLIELRKRCRNAIFNINY